MHARRAAIVRNELVCFPWLDPSIGSFNIRQLLLDIHKKLPKEFLTIHPQGFMGVIKTVPQARMLFNNSAKLFNNSANFARAAAGRIALLSEGSGWPALRDRPPSPPGRRPRPARPFGLSPHCLHVPPTASPLPLVIRYNASHCLRHEVQLHMADIASRESVPCEYH